MKKAVAVLLTFFLISGPASAVVIVSGTQSGIFTPTGTSPGPNFTYDLQGGGNAIVFGYYHDNALAPSNLLIDGAAPDGFIQDPGTRTLLAYKFNPNPSVNVSFDVGTSADNAGYFLYELSYVDTAVAANIMSGQSITTTSADRFVANFSGINFSDGAGATPAAGSIISSSNVTDINGGIGGGALASGFGYAPTAGVQTLGWDGGPAYQGEVAVAFATAAGSPTPWNVDGGGDYNVGANWLTGSVPADNPFFGSSHATDTTADIALTAPVSVSGMTISNVNPYNINGPSTLELTGGANLLVGEGTHEISAVITGTSGLVKSGGGNLALSANNTYTGLTQVTGGTLQLANTGAVDGAVSVAAAGQLAFRAGYNGTFAGDISGAGGVVLDQSLTTETVTFNNAKTYSGATNVLGGTLAISNAGALGSGDSTPETGTTISGNGSTGNAKLALSGNVNVANELLTLFPRRGDGVADLVHVSSTGNNTWGGNIKGDVNGDNYNFESTSGTLTLGGTISAPDNDSGVRNFVFKGNGNFNVTGKITDTETNANGEQLISSLDEEANVFVYKQGSGTLTIGTATNEARDFWRGGTFVEEGTLEVLAGGGTQGELYGPISVSDGATFDVDNFTTYAMSIGSSISGSGTVLANTFKVFDDNLVSPGDGVGTLMIDGNMQLSDEGDGGGVLTFELGDDPTTIGGTENDLIQLGAGHSLTTIGAPQMTVRVLAVEGAISEGQYRLISHAGGSVNVSGLNAQFNDALGNPLTTRQQLDVVSTSGQVNLEVIGESKNLVWTGANGTAWDKNTTVNWSDGAGEVFFDQDQVTFNDSVSTPLPGDFNGDRAVDIADYTVWRNNLGGNFDLNGNGDEAGGSSGVVDAADYELWKANFGETSPGVTVDISGEDVYPSVANFDSSSGNRFVFTGTNGFGGETPINLTGNVTVALQNSNTLQGVVTLGADTTLELGGSTVEGDITGAGFLNINGGATINSALSLTGPIAVNSTVFPNNAMALGTTDSGTTINAAGTIWYNFQNLSVAEPIALNGGLLNVAGNPDSALTLTGNINVNANGGEIRVNPDMGDDALVITSDITGTASGAITANVSPGSLMTINGDVSNNGALIKSGDGTLVISETTAITSAEIRANGGSLDVSAKTALPISDGQTLSGAFGTVTGNVTASSGSVVRVGQVGLPSGTIYMYTDATWGAEDSNTVVASDGSTLTPLDNIFGTQAEWNDRNFSNGNTVLQGQLGDNADQAPTLKTTIGGLNPGQEYEVQVNIWTDGGGWQILAGDSAENLTLFVAGAPDSGTIDTNGLLYDSSVLTSEGNRTMYGAPLTLTANASGEIEVFIDENSANNAARTWYDGISIASEGIVSQSFTIDGDLAFDAGSIFQVDIASSGVNDLLTLTGDLGVADGFILEVMLDDSVAADSLIAGDTWNLLDFASATGTFDEGDFILPGGLAAGLAWDTSNLLTTGELSVVAAGSLQTANIPEPSSALLVVLATVGLGIARRQLSRSRG